MQNNVEGSSVKLLANEMKEISINSNNSSYMYKILCDGYLNFSF